TGPCARSLWHIASSSPGARPKKPVWGYRGPLSTAGIEACRDGQFRRDRGAFRIEIGNEGWNFPIQDPDTTTVDFVNGLNASRLNDGSKPLFGNAQTTALHDNQPPK